MNTYVHVFFELYSKEVIIGIGMDDAMPTCPIHFVI